MDARNPKYNAAGSIDLEIKHPKFGWIPFTASPNDIESTGRSLYAKAVSGEFGTVEPYAPSAQDILVQKKAQRKATVDSITVTVQSGKVFDGNEVAQSRMANCILVAGITGLTECTWILANNVPTTVTLAELQEALALSVQAMGAVWAEPYL